MLYGLQDVTLIPATISEINSRSECNPLDKHGKLPIFTAPMSQIINEDNWQTFDKHVHTIIPRNVDLDTRLRLSVSTFSALSLEEFIECFCSPQMRLYDTHHILIDVANGHMNRLIEACSLAKLMWGDQLILMAGNVANPNTYREYAKAGIDYIRLSIGSGSQCTTANTGIFYPMASLIKATRGIQTDVRFEIAAKNPEYKSVPKIVADGGFNSFGDIIKALALGANYVMCGKIFAKTIEACGEIHWGNYPAGFDVLACGPFNEWIRHQDIDYITRWGCFREYYGMSTKRAQKEFGKEGNKTEEGIGSIITVDYSLNTWITEFTDYLKSAMSYTNHKNVSDFIGGVEHEYLSPTTIRTFK